LPSKYSALVHLGSSGGVQQTFATVPGTHYLISLKLHDTRTGHLGLDAGARQVYIQGEQELKVGIIGHMILILNKGGVSWKKPR
jgi:hypothetical protein